MRIVCPSCAAAYDVPESQLAPGRMVKCAQCGTGWAPVVAVLRTTPPQPRLVEPEPVLPEPVPVTPAHVPVTVVKSAPITISAAPASPVVLAGWAASVALLALVTVGAYAWRAEVMQAWPESERAYMLFGLTAR